MKILNKNEQPAYNNCYHFVASVYKRNCVFMTKEMRDRLEEVVNKTMVESKGLKIHAITVAYNHYHVLIEGEINPSDIAQVLFGASSRIMRKDYISLKKEMPRLWGGKSCTFIQDENHLQNTISYIKRHQPDNTKLSNF